MGITIKVSQVKLGVLCYIRKGGETLMLHRNKKENDVHEGKWNGLGGKIEPGESPDEAVRREVMEESGLILINYRLRGVITFPQFKDSFDWYVYLYESNEFRGNIIDSPEGELHWIENEKITSLNLWEGDHLFFEWLNQSRFFSAKIEYQGEHLKDHEVRFN